MKKFGVFMILVLLLVSAASAATVTVSPTKIDPGDTVTVDVQNLPDGAAFSLGIRGEFDVTPGDRFAFTARNLVLPFSLGSGEVSAYSRGTEWTGVSAQMPDGTSASLINYADANGEVRTTQAYTISSGTYSAVALDGRAAPAAGSVVTEVTMRGTKTGPDDGTISFAIDGITYGTATVSVDVDGQRALSQKITIGSPSGNGGSPSSGSSGPLSPGGSPGAPFIPEPTATPTTVTSTDRKVSLTGPGALDARLELFTAQGTAPAGWSLSGSAYAVTPEGRTFDPAVTLSFALPSADATATIARYENGVWTPVPSKIQGDRITTTITAAGAYALLVAATPAGETAVATPTLASAETETTAAPAATTPAAAPFSPLLPVIAFGILMFGWLRRG